MTKQFQLSKLFHAVCRMYILYYYIVYLCLIIILCIGNIIYNVYVIMTNCMSYYYKLLLTFYMYMT